MYNRYVKENLIYHIHFPIYSNYKLLCVSEFPIFDQEVNLVQGQCLAPHHPPVETLINLCSFRSFHVSPSIPPGLLLLDDDKTLFHPNWDSFREWRRRRRPVKLGKLPRVVSCSPSLSTRSLSVYIWVCSSTRSKQSRLWKEKRTVGAQSEHTES